MDLRSKKKIGQGIDSDMISNLPENITDDILVRLPIKEAVRTCVLSTKWRYKWTTIPDLVFHSDSFDGTRLNEMDKFIDFIDGVFLHHSGLIEKFELITMSMPSSSSDRWVLYLSSKNIKEFKLMFFGDENNYYVLPSYFFSAQQLCTLELHRCVLEPPPTFTGFANLKTLYLSQITLDNSVLERLISRCPLVESLSVFSCDGLDHPKICAPNLKCSRLSGNFSDISFENTPVLSDLTIFTDGIISDQQLELFMRNGTCPLVKFLSSLPNIKKFRMLFEEGIEFLAACNIPDRLPFMCYHLSRLTLTVDFEYLNQILVIFCLFNSSPNLYRLRLLVCSERYSSLTSEGCTAVYDLNEIQRRIGCNMDRLKVIKMHSHRKWKLDLELKFITFVLANTPRLKMLSFETFNEVQFSLREICNLPRASPNAKVKYSSRRRRVI